MDFIKLNREINQEICDYYDYGLDSEIVVEGLPILSLWVGLHFYKDNEYWLVERRY